MGKKLIGNFNSVYFQASSQNCEKRPLASPCLCVRMEQLGFHWSDFHKIWFVAFRKSVNKIQFLWKSDENNWYFKWRHINIYHNILPNYAKYLRRNLQKKTQYIQHFFFRKFSHLWNNVKKYDRARHATDDNKMGCRKDVICMTDN